MRLILALIVDFTVACGFYGWLKNGQYASVLSRFNLFVQCLFWPLILVTILGFEIYSIIRYWNYESEQKWEDLKPADPGPRKKK